jgi:hypothetical protein
MTAQSVALSLLQGWNFVSFSYPASSDAATVCSELKTQGRGCTEVAIYQNGAWQTYTPTSGTSFALSPAQGFMVYIPTAGSWTPQ